MKLDNKKLIFFVIIPAILIISIVLTTMLVCKSSGAPAVEEAVIPFITVRTEPAYDPAVYDTVIRNARLINPETNSDLANFNIGITNGRIAALTRRPLQGTQEIDAEALVAVPGFIDVISFELGDMSERYKISDGVTTNLVMHGGTTDAKKWYERLAARPYLVNYGASSFITLMRREVGIGYYDRMIITNPDHIEELVNNVRRNITDGALGISMSPEYAPGVQGAEMLALSKLAAEMGVATYYHLRYSRPDGEYNSLVGIKEVLDLARETGVSTHIMHITSTGSTYVADEAFKMVNDAIAEGLDITACLYPYDFWASNISSTRFDPGWQDRFKLTYNDLQLPATSVRLTPELFSLYRSENMIVFARNTIPEEEIRLALQQPFTSISSDEYQTGRTHPRGSGTFSRTIGRYARDEGVISLMKAISMMTLMPSRRLAGASDDIKRKGRLEIGADADIVLFDYDTIIDTATPENPASYSKGIKYVFVNGQIGVDPNGIRSIRAGKAIKSRFASPAPSLAYTDYNLYVTNPQKTAVQDERITAGKISTYELFNLHFADLKAVAEILHKQDLALTFTLSENGNISFGQAKLVLGESGFTSYGQESHLHHEPLIYKGSVYLPVDDLPDLFFGLTYEAFTGD